MLSKKEIEMLEELTNRCQNCGNKEELGFCVDCYMDESEMNIIRKLFVDFKQLETNNKKLIEKLEEDITEYPEAKYTKWYLIDILEILKGEKE